MKKNRIFFFLTLAIVMVAMLSACSTEEVIEGGAKKHQLTISVKDGLFTSQTETRTTPTGDNGLGTEFTINDKIGIFGVKGGQVVVSNVCYTCDGHLWNGENTITYDENTTYYAYYPWNSDADLMKVAGVAKVADVVNPSATTADEFFKPLIDKWNPIIDQSKIENYNASDLMVGKGVAPTGNEANPYTMKFTMDHQMGLCLTTLEEINFVVDATYKFKLMPNYKFTTDVKPCYYQGKYRYIVKPGNNRELKVANGKEIYTINYFVKGKGNYTEHIVGGCDKEYQPEVGDIYYSDGSMTHAGEISIYKRQVGVVGYAAQHTPDAVLDGYTHGLVICGLSFSLGTIGSVNFTDKTKGIIDQYSNTVYCYNDILKNYKGKEITEALNKSEDRILANSYTKTMSTLLADINQKVSLEQNSTAPNSGWFCPASAQLYNIINGLYMKKSKKNIGADETYSKTSVTTPLQVMDLKKNLTAMFEQLGEGHYSEPKSFTTVSAICDPNGKKDSNRCFSFVINHVDPKPEEEQTADQLLPTNDITNMYPIIAF